MPSKWRANDTTKEQAGSLGAAAETAEVTKSRRSLAADESSNRETSWQTYWIGAPTPGPPASGMIPDSVAEC